MENRFIRTHEELAQIVQETRQRQGLDHTELAQRANVTVEFVHGLEQATERENLGWMMRVVRALNIWPLAMPAPEVTRTYMDLDPDEVMARFTPDHDGVN